MNKIPIFIMFFNRPEWTALCLSAIKEHTNPNQYEIVLIDNGSDEHSSSLIKNYVEREFKGCRLVEFATPVGCAYAYNSAVSEYALNTDRFVIMHNDVVVTDGWLDGLCKGYDTVLKSNPNSLSCVFPRTNYATQDIAIQNDYEVRDGFSFYKLGNKTHHEEHQIQEVIEKTYDSFGGLPFYAQKNNESFAGQFKMAMDIGSFCVLMNKQVFFDIGMFNASFINFGGEFRFYNYLTFKKSVYPFLLLDVYVHHNGNTTTDYFGKDFGVDQKRSDDLFNEKRRDVESRAYEKVLHDTKILSGDLRVLAIRDNGIGDIVMSMFALSGLKKINENIKITYLTDPKFMDFIRGFSCVDSVLPLSEEFMRKENKSKLDLIEIEEMYVNKFDFVFNWIDYFEVYCKNPMVHRVDAIIENVLEKFGNIVSSDELLTHPEYRVKEGGESLAKAIYEAVGDDYAVISPYGTCGIRSIPNDVADAIITHEAKKGGIVILGQDKYSQISETIKGRSGVLDLSGRTVLSDVPMVLKSSRRVYTPDSGIFHIASILGIKVKAFFGSVSSDLRARYYENECEIYEKVLPCSPCFDVGCKDILCMAYTPEEIDKILNGGKK